MKRKFVIGIDGSGLAEAIKEVSQLPDWLKEKSDLLASRLSDAGVLKIQVGFTTAFYDGTLDFTVSSEKFGVAHFVVGVDGKSVLFVEFGTGLIGYGHPEPQGYGPGTYPPTDPAHPHWNQPHGWWYNDGGERHHTYGNYPNMPVYSAVKNLEQEFEQIVREVFESD